MKTTYNGRRPKNIKCWRSQQPLIRSSSHFRLTLREAFFKESLFFNIFQCMLNNKPTLEDNLKFWAIGRRPQIFEKWKTTLFLYKMEDDLNSFQIGRRPQLFSKMEENLRSKVNGRQHKLKCTWKTTSFWS